MELRQLEYFVAVTEEANFTRAAAKLHVAQPGVSAQIHKLERELGQPLLDRSARNVRLTQAGEAVLPCARAALAAVANARLVVDELAGLVRGRVAVGMIASVRFDLAGLLADFHDQHPNVEITLTEAPSHHLVEALRARHLDLALVGSVSARPRGIGSQVVGDEALVAAVARDDPLATKTSITLAGLAQRRLISLRRGTGLRSRFDEACTGAGIQARVAFEASTPHILGQLAARGLGVAILPESFTDAHSNQLHALLITRPGIRAQIELAWRAEGPTSPAARALVNHARSALPDLSPVTRSRLLAEDPAPL
ncbi:MAG: LysR family transcriptional regulator [Acidimicrobiales bacterium]